MNMNINKQRRPAGGGGGGGRVGLEGDGGAVTRVVPEVCRETLHCYATSGAEGK